MTAVVAGLNGAGPGGAVRPGEALAGVMPADRCGPTRTAPVPRSRPGILLDRDGTIIVDHGYVGSIDRVEFIEGAPEAIARFSAASAAFAMPGLGLRSSLVRAKASTDPAG